MKITPKEVQPHIIVKASTTDDYADCQFAIVSLSGAAIASLKELSLRVGALSREFAEERIEYLSIDGHADFYGGPGRFESVSKFLQDGKREWSWISLTSEEAEDFDEMDDRVNYGSIRISPHHVSFYGWSKYGNIEYYSREIALKNL